MQQQRSHSPGDILDIEYNNSSDIYLLGALVDAMQTAKQPYGVPTDPEKAVKMSADYDMIPFPILTLRLNNPDPLSMKHYTPMTQSHPAAFWLTMSAGLFVISIICLYCLLT